MRSKTVSRRGLIVGTAATAIAPGPEPRYCFAITIDRLSAADITRIHGLRHGWTLRFHSGIEATLDK